MGLRRTLTAQQQWDDPWLARDKVEHFAFCLAITVCAYQAARWREPLRRYRLLLGCAAGVAAGLLKELGDGLQVRPPARRPSAAASSRLPQPPTVLTVLPPHIGCSGGQGACLCVTWVQTWQGWRWPWQRWWRQRRAVGRPL